MNLGSKIALRIQEVVLEPIIMDYIVATRPWSFTAALVPVLVTAAVSKVSFHSVEFLRAISVAISVQAGANLTNTYFDFKNGVDTEQAGEKTLVLKKCDPSAVLVFSFAFFALAIASIWPYLADSDGDTLRKVFGAGIALSFFYTATPVGLKYKALGDITIFMCFGPLLMQCCSILFTGSTNGTLYIYSIPIGCFTEAILHANNARDIESDKKANAITLASLIGPKMSEYFFLSLLISSYITVIVITLLYHWGCIATLVSAPITMQLVNQYQSGKLDNIDEETAKAHLPFGVTMFLGVFFTNSGLLSQL